MPKRHSTTGIIDVPGTKNSPISNKGMAHEMPPFLSHEKHLKITICTCFDTLMYVFLSRSYRRP